MAAQSRNTQYIISSDYKYTLKSLTINDCNGYNYYQTFDNAYINLTTTQRTKTLPFHVLQTDSISHTISYTTSAFTDVLVTAVTTVYNTITTSQGILHLTSTTDNYILKSSWFFGSTKYTQSKDIKSSTYKVYSYSTDYSTYSKSYTLTSSTRTGTKGAATRYTQRTTKSITDSVMYSTYKMQYFTGTVALYDTNPYKTFEYTVMSTWDNNFLTSTTYNISVNNNLVIANTANMYRYVYLSYSINCRMNTFLTSTTDKNINLTYKQYITDDNLYNCTYKYSTLGTYQQTLGNTIQWYWP